MKKYLFKNFLALGINIWLLNTVSANELSNMLTIVEQKEYNISYEHNGYIGKHQEYEVKKAISSGLNYWIDCFNKKATLINGDIPFKIIWSETLSNKEFGAVNYSKENNEIISFIMELNKNKNFTLKQIQALIPIS